MENPSSPSTKPVTAAETSAEAEESETAAEGESAAEAVSYTHLDRHGAEENFVAEATRRRRRSSQANFFLNL